MSLLLTFPIQFMSWLLRHCSPPYESGRRVPATAAMILHFVKVYQFSDASLRQDWGSESMSALEQCWRKSEGESRPRTGYWSSLEKPEYKLSIIPLHTEALLLLYSDPCWYPIRTARESLGLSVGKSMQGYKQSINWVSSILLFPLNFGKSMQWYKQSINWVSFSYNSRQE